MYAIAVNKPYAYNKLAQCSFLRNQAPSCTCGIHATDNKSPQHISQLNYRHATTPPPTPSSFPYHNATSLRPSPLHHNRRRHLRPNLRPLPPPHRPPHHNPRKIPLPHKNTGAALALGPNASGLLIDLGWRAENSGAMVPKELVSVNGETGEVRARMYLVEYGKKWKSPWSSLHRVDLHRELRRLVEVEGGEVVLGCRVVGNDVGSGRVEVEDGRAWKGDVVIGADGNGSVVRSVMCPDAELRPWGKKCYRWLVDREVLAADPETRCFTESDGCIWDVAGPDSKFVMYPCRNDTMFNFVAFLSDDEQAAEGDDWDKTGSKSKLLKGFDNFSPIARKLLPLAGNDLKVWQLVDMVPLPSFHVGRVALIGDAAHPTLPFLSQGAGLAIEDAISIGTLLQLSTSSDEVPDLLKLYSGIRKPRTNQVHKQSRVHGVDERKGRPPPDALHAMLNFCHTHDEKANSEEELREWRVKMASGRA